MKIELLFEFKKFGAGLTLAWQGKPWFDVNHRTDRFTHEFELVAFGVSLTAIYERFVLSNSRN